MNEPVTELHPRFSEQGAYLDGREEPAWREQGTASQLDALAAELKEEPR